MKLILADLSAYITAHLTVYSLPIYMNVFPTSTGEAVMMRADPGNPVETRYLDGSRTGAFPFSIFARSADSQKAYDQLCDMQSALDIADVDLTDETRVSIVPTSQPTLVQRTEAGESTYTAGFRLEYFTRG